MCYWKIVLAEIFMRPIAIIPEASYGPVRRLLLYGCYCDCSVD